MEFEFWVRIVKESIQKGNIDPWNINVAKVADEYIKTIRELKKFDIRLSADVILVGGILLRMKSQVLYERCESVFEEEVDDSDLENDSDCKRTDTERKRYRERNRGFKGKKQITVEDLIDTLKWELKKVKKSRERKREKNEEMLYQVIEEMEEYDISELMEELILELKKEGIIVFQNRFSDRESRVKNFLPCLYLASEGKVEILQRDLFQEILLKYRG